MNKLRERIVELINQDMRSGEICSYIITEFFVSEIAGELVSVTRELLNKQSEVPK